MITETTTGDKVAEMMSDLVHYDTQVHSRGVDLTVDEVYKCTGAAELDFGGSEFNAATLEPIEPVKRNEDDDYGWWNLNQGAYVIKLNEQLADEAKEHPLFIASLEHLSQSGCVLSSLNNPPTEHPINLSFYVGEHGIKIKENARVAQIVTTA